MPKTYRAKLKKKPDLIGLARQHPRSFPALLASNTKNTKTGRYSILFARSKSTIKAFNQTQLNQLLNKINQKIQKCSTDDLPFYSGWFLYFAYESVAQ
uniref:Para-aminobenzoate synthase, aminase component n=1 Tax=uncultured Thiotrichaceae bacterium TaxID=298394 RepID=A0A6S6TLF3_9GAMM|nr:MAG: Para-aminobenzoate synthase, aminase component [uncultured Thiotrichaceae bacterium]